MRGLLVAEGPLRVPSGQALREPQGERVWEARVRWGVGDAIGDGDAPRRAPLDSCLRRNDARERVREGRGGVGVGVGARSRGRAVREPPPTTGVGRTRAGVMRGLLVVEGPLRQAQGERIWEGRLQRGVGDAMGDGGAPRPAPLDSCLRRNDARGGVREGRGGVGVGVEGPFDRLRANGFGRGACGGVWGMRWGTETPCASPLPWVPARAGTTMGGVVGCVGARGSGQGGWPALAGGRFANRPYDRGVCGVAGMREGPLRVPSA